MLLTSRSQDDLRLIRLASLFVKTGTLYTIS